jgi:hypothetical protein
MKRLMSAALALALLSGTAASADPFGYGPRGGHHERYDRGWDHRRHRDNDAGTAFAVGFGLLALTAIVAAADRDRDETRVRAYDYPPPPPPPPPRYRDQYGPAPDRDRSYDQGRDYQDQPAYDDGYGPYQQ